MGSLKMAEKEGKERETPYLITKEGEKYIEQEIEKFRKDRPELYARFTKIARKLIKKHYLEKSSLRDRISGITKRKKTITGS